MGLGFRIDDCGLWVVGYGFSVIGCRLRIDNAGLGFRV